MKKAILLVLLMSIAVMPLWGIINDNLRLTSAHAVPTAYTLNQGEVLIGIGPLAYGIHDKFQIGTNMLLDILQVFNADIKLNILDFEAMGLAAGVGFAHFGLFGSNYNSFLFSGLLTIPVSQNLKFHTGGTFAYIPDFDIGDMDFEGGAEAGTTIPLDIEINLSEHSALLGGAAYDLTFEYYRVGVSYLRSWEQFNLQLGGNISGGGAWTYFLPTIGIWWRF